MRKSFRMGCFILILLFVLCGMIGSIELYLSNRAKKISPVSISIGDPKLLALGQGIRVGDCEIAVSKIVDRYQDDEALSQIIVLVHNKTDEDFLINDSDFTVYTVNRELRILDTSSSDRTRMDSETIPPKTMYRMSLFVEQGNLGTIEYRNPALGGDQEIATASWKTDAAIAYDKAKLIDDEKKAEADKAAAKKKADETAAKKKADEAAAKKKADEAAAKKKADEAAAKAVEDTSISIEEGVMLQSTAKRMVEAVLKAPSTAEYPGSWLDPYEGWAISQNKSIYEISSYVDSQNSFGAMIRSEYYIKIKDTGESFELKKFVFAGERIK